MSGLQTGAVPPERSIIVPANTALTTLESYLEGEAGDAQQVRELGQGHAGGDQLHLEKKKRSKI